MLPKFTVICMILTHSKEVKSVTAAFFFSSISFFFNLPNKNDITLT